MTKEMCYSFGEPETVLGNSMTDYLGVFMHPDGEYYVPPVSQMGLAKITRANAHHGTIPYFKRNMLCMWFIENKTLSTQDLGNAGIDFFVLGNAYFKKIYNRARQVVRFVHLPALNMRRMKNKNKFCMLRANNDSPIEFKADEIVHLKEYDITQQVYGIPQYLGGINSVLLNESATLFRRRYYNNGAHMGFVFYTADANLDPEDEKELKEQIKKSKGVGNFRSMFLNIPGGRPDSVKIIPVGDIATKDEFEKIKNLSRNDVLSMWRIQPALAGVMPDNAGGFGDIEKISRVYHQNETMPVHRVFMELNQHINATRKIRFNPILETNTAS